MTRQLDWGDPAMARPRIGIGTAMVAILLLALVVAVALQGRALREQDRRIAALEAQTRRFQMQSFQLANMMNQGFSNMSQDRSWVRGRLDGDPGLFPDPLRTPQVPPLSDRHGFPDPLLTPQMPPPSERHGFPRVR